MPDDVPLFNTEKLGDLLRFYRLPLILGLAAIVFVSLSFVILLHNSVPSSDIVFTTETEATRSGVSKIRVDIAGAVMSPGVYDLSDGSRITDALTLAGGLSAKADREWIGKNLNRAAKLVDGGKVYIPAVGESTGGEIQSSKSKVQNEQRSGLLGVQTEKVNINTASQSELEGLPGVGPVTGRKILDGRPYQTIEELKTKKILGEKAFEKVRDLISL